MQDLNQRVGPAIVALIAFFALSYYDWGFGLLLMFCALGCYYESYRIGKLLLPRFSSLFLIINFGAVIYTFFILLESVFPELFPNTAITPIQPWGAWLYLCFLLFLLKTQYTKDLYPLINTFYPGVGILSIILIVFASGTYQLHYLLVLLLCVWFADAFAYFGGSLIKGRKLASHISPNKTVSGWISALLGVFLISILAGRYYFEWEWSFILVWSGVIWLSSTMGDLFESNIKRNAGIKDSGKFLPGHGGFLDRLDSIIYSAPFALYLLLKYELIT